MTDKQIVSLIALVLLLLALLVPLPIATTGNVASAFAFALPASLLSLGLALLSRSEYFSKIVLWCFGSTIGIAVIGMGVSVPLFMAQGSRQMVVEREAAVAAEMLAAKEAKIRQLKAEAESTDSKSSDDPKSSPTDGAGLEMPDQPYRSPQEENSNKATNGSQEGMLVVAMSPQEMFRNSWFELSIAWATVLSALIVAILTIAFLGRRFRMIVARIKLQGFTNWIERRLAKNAPQP